MHVKNWIDCSQPTECSVFLLHYATIVLQCMLSCLDWFHANLKKFKILKMDFFQRFSKRFNVEEFSKWEKKGTFPVVKLLLSDSDVTPGELSFYCLMRTVKDDSRRNVHEPLNVFLFCFIFGWTFYTSPLKEQALFCVWTALETLGMESKHVTSFECELVANSIFKALLEVSWERVN